MRGRVLACAALMLFGVSAEAQKLDSYLGDMQEALVPYATMKSTSCHSVEIDMNGPWGDFAIPSGVNKTNEIEWAVLRVDVLRLYVNLSDLDEDKLQNKAIFSLEYISRHEKGTPYNPDTPAVMLFTHGLNTAMTVHAVDLDKVHALRGKRGTESDMGLSIDERKFVIIPFQDQAHADVFNKAILRAIVLCKAQ